MLETVDLTAPKLDRETYRSLYKPLVRKLVVLQQQARLAGTGLVVLLEGWSGAGKGSRISDLMYELDARATSVYVTEPKNPQAARKFAGLAWGVTGMQPIMQEFWQALGERGTMTFYDRGWYSAAAERAVFDLAETEPKVERRVVRRSAGLSAVEEGAAKARDLLRLDAVREYQRIARDFERTLVDDGYVVVKLFVHVSKKAQRRRMERLHADPQTAWRVSEQKLQRLKYYDRTYKIYDRLLEGSDFDFAPWTLVNGEDRRAANLLIAQTLVDALEGALAGADAATDAAVVAPHAPESSAYSLVSTPPRIDHETPHPHMESDEAYRAALKREQRRLATLELEMYQKRVPLLLMFEGWDAAGKGGAIKRVAQAIDARAYTVFPSPAPTKPELMHPHLWRYWTRLPKAGHVGIYDRSWYGRVLVERIEGFATPAQWTRAYDEINAFENELVQWGALLIKFWVDVTPDEQLRRFEDRMADPSKQWKITDEDWRNREKYPQYRDAVDDMFRLTCTTYAPWNLLLSDDKRYARIEALRTINDALAARLHG